MNPTQYIPSESKEEAEQIDFLLGVMGGLVDRNVALRVYRKFKGSVERAADALLSGDTGEDYHWDDSQTSSKPPTYSQSVQEAGQPLQSSSTMVNLSGQEMDELNRAMAMSLESEPSFGPSNRVPDPNWAMVPANLESDSKLSHEDKSFKEAIQASLKDFASANESDPCPIEETVREGGRPVALRPENPRLAYAALFLQAMFFVPQVRDQVATLQLPNIPSDTPRDSPARAIWNLVELFTNFDLAHLSVIVDTEVLPSLQAAPLDDHNKAGETSTEFSKLFADVVGAHLQEQTPEGEQPPRLFHFTHGHVELPRRMRRQVRKYPSSSTIVVVDYGNETCPYTDLMSCLCASLSTWSDTGSGHDVIFEPSDVFCFHLKRCTQESGKYNAEAFTYSKHIWLDQFLFENLDLANQKRAAEHELYNEISELMRMKEGLTRHNNRDTIKDLETALHYFGNVAEANGDVEREEALKRTKTKLQTILTNISRKLEAIDYKIEKLQAEAANVFNCPDLHKHQYDLRAVLVHTGLPGRKQLYSYVQDNQGVWWKTLDYTVTEVPEETVLCDPTGIHLCAGPYMLIYSRHIDDAPRKMPEWPRLFSECVETNNSTFLACLPPELAAKAKISSNSPPPSQTTASQSTSTL